ncbi:MAG: iron-sulfur cluster carrier protein ApbC [Dongiaceae bacterium]
MKEIITEKLRQIHLPETDINIIEAGLVKSVEIKDKLLTVILEIREQLKNSAIGLQAAIEAALQNLPGIETVRVILTSHRAPAAAAPVKLDIPGIQKIIVVASGKGGVGKSTVAVNLALALSKQNLKVGLLDADIYGPSAPRLLGLKGRPEIKDKKIIPFTQYGIKAMSMGFLVEEEAPTIWRGPMVMGAIQQLLQDVAWGELDILVIDMPPGTGDAQLTISQRVPVAGAVIVSTPQDIALIDARKGLKMFERVQVPILGIVENMSYFTCPACDTRHDIFGHGGAREEAKRLNVPFLGGIPLQIAIRQTSDEGKPIVISNPQSAEAKTFYDVAEKVLENLKAAGRPAPKIAVQN